MVGLFDVEVRSGFDINERHHLIFGVEGRYAYRQDQSNFDVLEDGPDFYLDDKRD